MGMNYLNPELREKIIQDIDSNENLQRKKTSLQQFEIYSDRIKPYVTDYLKGFYSTTTVNEMPIVSSINLARRITNQEASIYMREPVRTFIDVSEDQKAVLEQVYKDMKANTVFLKANRFYKLQDQGHLQVIPSQGQLKMRALLAHQLDVVTSNQDPESADAYILNGFDRSLVSPNVSENSDSVNNEIADAEDYKANVGKYSFWSDEQNFVTDDHGNIISGPDVTNPIQIMPFVDVASCKDGEYWIRPGNSVTDFTVQWNGAASDLGHVVRMQGFAQAFIKGDSRLMPQNMQIGPNFIVKLPIDANSPVETDFGFANPNPDVAGSIQYVEMVLSSFLTSRGLDPKVVNGKGDARQYGSGIERLLALVEQFEPAKSDFDLFRCVEERIFQIVKAYLNTYAGTDVLKYKIAPLSDSAAVSVQFSEPTAIQSDAEKLDSVQRRLELGLISQVEAIMKDRGVSEEEAMKVNAVIKQEMSPQPSAV